MCDIVRLPDDLNRGLVSNWIWIHTYPGRRVSRTIRRNGNRLCNDIFPNVHVAVIQVDIIGVSFARLYKGVDESINLTGVCKNEPGLRTPSR